MIRNSLAVFPWNWNFESCPTPLEAKHFNQLFRTFQWGADCDGLKESPVLKSYFIHHLAPKMTSKICEWIWILWKSSLVKICLWTKNYNYHVYLIQYAHNDQKIIWKIAVTDQLSLKLMDCEPHRHHLFPWMCRFLLEYMYLSFRIHHLLFITLDIDVINVV